MHKQISDWTYTHFPDKECGEWFGYLHRDGTPAQMAKGNLFKGPFHIPRNDDQGLYIMRGNTRQQKITFIKPFIY